MFKKWLKHGTAILFLPMIACGGGGGGGGSTVSSTSGSTSASLPVVVAPTGGPAPAGRLLASNCFQCHGTNGNPVGGFDRLAGESASEIYSELKEFQSGQEEFGIMTKHALAYTDQQIRLIADYFSKQPRVGGGD